MGTESLSGFVDALARLLAPLVWPATIVFVLLRLERPISELIASLSEFSIKGGGFEASGKRKTEAAAALGAALAKPQNLSGARAMDPRLAGQVVAEAVTPQVYRWASGARLLWIDDRPDNNLNERRALRALGITIHLGRSTDEGLGLIKEEPFDVIVSDMARPGDETAGLTLLDKLRDEGNETPTIIYAGRNAVELRAEARKKGAFASTDRPDELFKAVLAALRPRGPA